MGRRYRLVIASIMIMVIGLLRGIGGISLLIKGDQLATGIPIIATQIQLKIVACGLLLICILMNYASINLLRKYSKSSWYLCWVVLLLFALGGLLNGYVLYGHPIDQGQRINLIASLLVSGFLLLGKSGLNDLNKN